MSTNKNNIQAILNSINTDPKTLYVLYKFFADCILKANSISRVGWVVYEINGSIILSISFVYTISITSDFSGKKINGIGIMVSEAMLNEQIQEKLITLGCTINDGFKHVGGAKGIVIPLENDDNFVQAVDIVQPAIEKYISNVLKPGKRTNWPKLYNPEIIQFLRKELNIVIPDPEYFHPTPPPEKNMFDKINDYLQSQGYFFTLTQISSFYTALQTKGFVILSGISGTGKTKLAQLFAEMLPFPTHKNENDEENGSNCLFLSVRPDWRDSKSLLGYFNPLTRHYETTPFLEFLLKARKNYDSENIDDRLAWFVILDEMNLARVEYYFADLLSVLESGRDDEGYTREPLRFIYDKMEEGEDPPPPEMTLPPNLYFIGTVNVDETTQSFSPKVLDRAFSLEFLDVDFESYTSVLKRERIYSSSQNEDDRQELLKDFTHNKTFVRIDKQEIKAFIQSHSEYEEKFQSLNEKLQPYIMHFGYRVFDEIMMFLKNAVDNKIDLNEAFDQSVLMKVLPKFHGSRGKLEKPLTEVLVWCAINKSNNAEPVKIAISEPENAIKPDEWECPTTAKRVLRMLQSLNSTGFASFG